MPLSIPDRDRPVCEPTRINLEEKIPFPTGFDCTKPAHVKQFRAGFKPYSQILG